jgi:hypothetical protein
MSDRRYWRGLVPGDVLDLRKHPTTDADRVPAALAEEDL